MRDNKARQIRIERKPKSSVHEDDNQHLWAVSYSDFLMVLLSFFILFYSADEKNRDSLKEKISHHFTIGQNNLQGQQESIPPLSRLPSSLKELDPSLVVETVPKNETVYIHFPENFFGPGQYELNKDQQESIVRLLKKLAPLAPEINLTFEGHSDQVPVSHSKIRNHVIRSNFVLSSLRAHSALEMAEENGFSEQQLSVKASASHDRNSRSLSIRITQRGVTP